MSLAKVFDTLGQAVLPKIASAAFPDTMDIMAETITIGAGGGRVKGASTAAYSEVPCTYSPMQVETRRTTGDKMVSVQQYLVKFPTHHDGERIDIDPAKHSLKVLERGNEPEKTFRVTSVRDKSGVIFEAICQRENVG
jgi:hypothetical protein